ncbi:zinc-finger domain-containing protein-containing protein [Coprinopsis cinerea AmutBmut pab1-1]|nr:zinc-finger domain-containing protein-containing protein [Coprinopsis cinerea AmutBmut pab1-1]
MPRSVLELETYTIDFESSTNPLHGDMMSTSRKGPFNCDKCKKEFKKWSKLMAHERREHDPDTVIERFPCQLPGCEFVTKYKGGLKQHVIIHDPNAKQPVCQFPGCGFVTIHKRGPKLHSARCAQYQGRVSSSSNSRGALQEVCR